MLRASRTRRVIRLAGTPSAPAKAFAGVSFELVVVDDLSLAV